MKVKNIKAKVAAKVAKGKAKVAAKAKGKGCSGGGCKPKPCAIALALVLAATLCGCGTTTPSRSQTLTMKDCIVNIYGSGDGTTNDVARVDIASQAMSIENSGTETQTATPQYTTDVKPDVDVNYNGPTKTAADGAQGIAEKLVDAFTSKGGSDCTDGSCTP